MTDIYPYISENETLSLTSISSYVNQVTGGIFWPLILLAMFIIVFVVTMAFGVARAFVYACFFCSVLAIFFAVGGLLNPIYMYLLFVMLAVGLMVLRILKSSPAPQI